MIYTSCNNQVENMSILNRIKKNIPEIIAEFPSVQVMYLFGSHAAGRDRMDSDVDIAVFTDGNESPTMDLELGIFLKQRIGAPVDVVILQKASPLLRHEVLRNKIRIFERNSAFRAIQEATAFHDYMDARHYQQKRFTRGEPDGQSSDHSAPVEQS